MGGQNTESGPLGVHTKIKSLKGTRDGTDTVIKTTVPILSRSAPTAIEATTAGVTAEVHHQTQTEAAEDEITETKTAPAHDHLKTLVDPTTAE
ncbi:MAG: hypothetical protein L6R39_001828, partial [Caloplaca ligustica]